MKPLKRLTSLGAWWLKITICIVAYFYFLPVILKFSFKSFYFFIAILFCVFSLIQLISSLRNKAHLIVLSGLMLFVISAYQLVFTFDKTDLTDFLVFSYTGAVGLLFAAKGNKF